MLIQPNADWALGLKISKNDGDRLQHGLLAALVTRRHLRNFFNGATGFEKFAQRNRGDHCWSVGLFNNLCLMCVCEFTWSRFVDRSRMGTSKWFVRARNLLGLFRLKLQPTGIKDGVSLEPASNPNNTNTNNPLQSNSVVAPNGLVQDFFTISKPTIFAPLSTQFPQARLNFIKDQVNLDFSAMQAVDHRKSPWSPSQAQRSDVMVGPRFTQVDFEKQVFKILIFPVFTFYFKIGVAKSKIGARICGC